MKTGCQIYVKGSNEAVAFYQRAFNLTIGMNFKNEDGTYAHASLMFRKREVLAVAEGGPVTYGGTMSFNCFELKTREAVDQAYRVLSEDACRQDTPDGPGSLPWSDYCFYLVDKFGVHWWVAI